MGSLRRAAGLLLVLAVLAAPALSQSRTRPAPDSPPASEILEIGPIPGWTTAWHPAPEQTSVPLGATLHFRAKVGQGAAFWTGARVVERKLGRATAECRLTTPGPHVVTVEVVSPEGERVRQRCLLNVVDTAVFPVAVSRPRLQAEPVAVDPAAPNRSAVARHFDRDSVAALREVAPGRYRTSTHRWLHLAVAVEPAGFAPLVEWRLDGEAQTHLGAALEMEVHAPGLHSLEAGPPEAAQAVDLETYFVRIVSHQSRGGPAVPDGEPVTFRAETFPGGFEEDITWLASTKHGTADPWLGEGPEFTVRFEGTTGVEGRWLGVRADNAVFGEDGKNPCQKLIPIGQHRIFTNTSMEPVVLIIAASDNAKEVDSTLIVLDEDDGQVKDIRLEEGSTLATSLEIPGKGSLLFQCNGGLGDCFYQLGGKTLLCPGFEEEETACGTLETIYGPALVGSFVLFKINNSCAEAATLSVLRDDSRVDEVSTIPRQSTTLLFVEVRDGGSVTLKCCGQSGDGCFSQIAGIGGVTAPGTVLCDAQGQTIFKNLTDRVWNVTFQVSDKCAGQDSIITNDIRNNENQTLTIPDGQVLRGAFRVEDISRNDQGGRILLDCNGAGDCGCPFQASVNSQ